MCWARALLPGHFPCFPLFPNRASRPPPRYQDSPPGNVSSRIAVLNDALLELVFNYVSRALFNADRLTLGMHMACHMGAGGVKAEEWDFFLGEGMQGEPVRGGAVTGVGSTAISSAAISSTAKNSSSL